MKKRLSQPFRACRVRCGSLPAFCAVSPRCGRARKYSLIALPNSPASPAEGKSSRRLWEARSLSRVADAILKSALARTESRGAHYRSDYPQHDDANFRKHSILGRESEGGVRRMVNADEPRITNFYKLRAAATADAHAHWKLKPPRCPVTSTPSPIKNNPGTFRASMVRACRSSVFTPPAVTSAFSKPSVPTG